jgi:hypothetical protein
MPVFGLNMSLAIGVSIPAGMVVQPADVMQPGANILFAQPPDFALTMR